MNGKKEETRKGMKNEWSYEGRRRGERETEHAIVGRKIQEKNDKC